MYVTIQRRRKLRRTTGRKLKQKLISDPEIYISTDQTTKAIKQSKNSKALGHDGISPVMLKHMGPSGIAFLTKIFNQVINTAIIPSNWKTGRIIPILKPGKPADEGKSYRPITLLSPAIKILERIILPDIAAAVPLAEHQHGFRKGHSTITAVNEITNHISIGLNKKKPVDRTVLVALDLTAAFDTVSHEILLLDIQDLQLNSRYKKFLASYLNGHQVYTEFRGCRSKFRIVTQGVPQGGALSPLLFNLYMSKMPNPPGKVKVFTYADDTTVLNSGPTIPTICAEINPYLDKLETWFTSRHLQISAAKSQAAVFTTFSNEANTILPVSISGAPIPLHK